MEVYGDRAGVFGLYELTDNGTILYSRQRRSDELQASMPEVIGRDFFHDFVDCDNRDDLRRHFRRFVTDRRPVDAFLFDYRFDREVIRTKIHMTRAFESEDDHGSEIVIMDVRQAGV
ncbi:MAG TPA: hypothetical protein VJV05_16640 [Pyrinomonadaceae bacterium]|nr:hypothetical protein [Pyrinomonadaceae bacterium]